MLKMYRIQIFCRNGDRHVIYAEFANAWEVQDAMMRKFPQAVWIIPTEARGVFNGR